jgi:hypothetical protein
MELASDQTAALAHHRLRISFFAPTPPGLKANDEFLVEDRLWPNVKLLGAPQAGGDDGCQLLPEIQVQKNAVGEGSQTPRVFKFRCVTPPTPKAAAASPQDPAPLQRKPPSP